MKALLHLFIPPLTLVVFLFFFKGHYDYLLENLLRGFLYSRESLPRLVKFEVVDVKPISYNITFLEKMLPKRPIYFGRGEKLPPPPQYRVSFIYVGKEKRFAIINGKLYQEGDKLGKYEFIEKIKEGKIKLRGRWGERWLKLSY